MNTSDYGFPEIRWHQTADFGFVPNLKMPNTFMAVAMDLCDRDSPFGRYASLFNFASPVNILACCLSM